MDYHLGRFIDALDTVETQMPRCVLLASNQPAATCLFTRPLRDFDP